MPDLFSSPQQNAQQAAQATADASNQEIGQEEQYVNTAEGNLRNAISGLGPNPYFTAPKAPAPMNTGKTTNFFSPTPGGAAPAPAESTNLFAKPAPQGQQRQPQPALRQTA